MHLQATGCIHSAVPEENRSPEKRGTGRGSGGIPTMSGGSNLTKSSCIDLRRREGGREGGRERGREGGRKGGRERYT